MPATTTSRPSSTSTSNSISPPAKLSGCRPTKVKASTGTRSPATPTTSRKDPLRSQARKTAIKLTLDQVIPPIEGTPEDPQVIAHSSPPQNGSSSSDSAAKSSAPSGVATCFSVHGSCFPTDSTNTPTQNIQSSSIRITTIPASAPRSSPPLHPIQNRRSLSACNVAIASFRTGPPAAFRA